MDQYLPLLIKRKISLYGCRMSCAGRNKLSNRLQKRTNFWDLSGDLPGRYEAREQEDVCSSVVRPHLGYATQIWAPQTIELIKRVERVQRRATKFILNLPFHCELTYEDRLQATDLLPISFWHEYLDLTFFFKLFNGLVCVSEEIIPERKHRNIRTTRATRNSDIITFRIRKCRTVTFQGSFMNRTARVWNILPAELRPQSLTLPRFKSTSKSSDMEVYLLKV